MAYNLTAQLNLQAPSQSSLKSIRSKIERGLRGIPLDIDTNSIAKAKKQIDDIIKKTSKIQVEAEAKNLPKVRQEVEKTGKSLEKADRQAKSFADAVALKAINYAPYAIASAAIIKVTGALSSATKEAIKFEQELAKIAQVTGRTVSGIIDQSSALSDLSIEYNLTLNKIAQVTRTLTQTGLSFREAAKGAEALAKTTLLATFDSIDSTTEGLIATMNSFNLTIDQGVASLDSINAVSKRFAIEAGDIVEAVRRAGGAYSAAGGTIEEFIAQLTAVRSTSRESAETIATGFRTIFGRLQRPKTIEYFKSLGIELADLNGNIVRPIEAIKRIQEGLDRLGISAGDVRFAQVVEQIGGIRQLSKVVPLLQETAKAQEALDAQKGASLETDEDVAKAQQTLGYRFGQLQKNFQSLVSEVVQTDSFKTLAGTFIDMANGLLAILRAIKPLIPFLTVLGTIKIGQGVLKAINAFSERGAAAAAAVAASGSGGGSGGGVQGYASGGFVPGSGNGDTVPALLTPGEFVINKKSAQAVGYSQLNRINKYAKGGIVQRYKQGGETEPSNVISSLEEGFSILKKVIEAMGEGGKNLLETLNVVEINDPGYRGKYSPKTNTIGLNIGAANSRTVAEEAFHALDIQKGGGKYASQQEGTFENRLAEIAKKTIQYKLEKAVEEGRISQQTLEYMLDAREAYAKLAKNSSPQIQAIIAAQGSVEDKMLALAEALEDPKNDPRGIFSGIGVNIAKEAGYKPSVPEEEVLYEPRLMSLIDAQRERDERAEKADLFSEIEFEAFLEKANKSGLGEADLIGIIKAQVEAGKKVDLEAIIKEQIETRNKVDLVALIKEQNKTGKESGLLSIALSGAKKKVLEWADSIDATKLAAFNTSVVAAGAALKNFTDQQFNQEALTPSLIRSQAVGEAGDAVKGALSRKNVLSVGKAIDRFGDSVSKTSPKLSLLSKDLGKSIISASPKIVKFGAAIGKAANLVGIFDTISGTLDALFSEDYTGQIDSYIAAGNATEAASFAQKKYAQELNRTIPVIGGLLNAFNSLSGLLNGPSFDSSGLLGEGENNSFSKAASSQANIVKTKNDLRDSRPEFEKSIGGSFSKASDVQRRGDAVTGRLSKLDTLISDININKAQSRRKSSGVNSLTGDIAAYASLGFLGGSAFLNPYTALGGAGLGAVAGYQKNQLSKKEANVATDATVNGIAEYAQALKEVTADADQIAQAAAKRTIEYGGNIVDALKSVTRNLGGDQSVEELYGFDPSSIKSAEDYERVIERLKKTRDNAAAAEKRQQDIADKGVSISQGRTLADVNAAKIAAEQAKVAKQRAEAGLKTLNVIKAQEIENQALNEQRKRSIALIKAEIEARNAENSLRDKISRTDKDIQRGEEARNQVNTGIVGKQTIIDNLGFGDIGKTLDETLRNEAGTSQLSTVAGNLQVGPQIQKAKAINDALLKLGDAGIKDQKSLEDPSFIRDILKKSGLGDTDVEDLTQSLTKSIDQSIKNEGSATAAIEQVRQQKVQETGGQAFNSVTERLDQVAQQQVNLQGERKQDTLDDLKNLLADRERTFNQEQDNIQTLSGYERQRRGRAVGSETALAINRAQRESFLEGEQQKAKQLGRKDSEILITQQLVQLREQELDSIKSKIQADIEYQKTVLRARSDLIKDYGLGTRSEQRSLQRTAGFASIAAKQGNFQGIPESQFANIRSFFERFSDVELPQFGGRKGKDILADIAGNRAIQSIESVGGRRLSKEEKQQIRDNVKEKLKKPKQLEDELNEARKNLTDTTTTLYELEKERIEQLKQLNKIQQDENNIRINELKNGPQNPPNGLAANQPPQLPQGAQNAPQGNIKIDLQGQQEVVVQLVSNGDVSAAAEKKAYEAISQRFNQLADRIQVTAPELAESFRQEGIA